MAKTITITILDSEEIENITADTITEDAATASHYNNVCGLIDMLTLEKKAMDSALIAKHGNVSYKSKILTTSVYDSYLLDTAKLAAEVGQDVIEKHKTKKRHTERVVKFG